MDDLDVHDLFMQERSGCRSFLYLFCIAQVVYQCCETVFYMFLLCLQNIGQILEVKIIFKELRINEEIRCSKVRLISNIEDEKFGIMPVAKAQQLAHERSLDLVEIAPQGNPPVCRLMDYSKYRFEQLKRDKEAKKNQRVTSLKEVKLRINIEEHDFETKAKNAQKFLQGKDKVKVTIMFRGREITHPELGEALCRKMAERLDEIAYVEKPANAEGRNMTMIMAPRI